MRQVFRVDGRVDPGVRRLNVDGATREWPSETYEIGAVCSRNGMMEHGGYSSRARIGTGRDYYELRRCVGRVQKLGSQKIVLLTGNSALSRQCSREDFCNFLLRGDLVATSDGSVGEKGDTRRAVCQWSSLHGISVYDRLDRLLLGRCQSMHEQLWHGD